MKTAAIVTVAVFCYGLPILMWYLCYRAAKAVARTDSITRTEFGDATRIEITEGPPA